jgi:hypothetical protein
MARTMEVATGGVATTVRIVGGIPDLQTDDADENVVPMQAPSKATG